MSTASSFEIELSSTAGHTQIPGAKDAPRYHALGNSMAVPVLSWIGRRLMTVDELVGRRGSLAGEVK